MEKKMTAPAKFIFIKGVMKLNPAWQAQQTRSVAAQPPSTLKDPEKALTIVSSTQDIAQASDAQEKATGQPMQVSDATVSTMEIMQEDPAFTDAFKSKKPIDGGELLEIISKQFSHLEVPIGLLNKLLALTQYQMHFKIDDSSSMGSVTDSSLKDASTFIKQRAHPTRLANANEAITRWEEAENRLHRFIEMLAYIPINPITLSFLNKHDRVVLVREGKTPEEFAADAHRQIAEAFKSGPNGLTPIHANLTEMFRNTDQKVMHYLLTDGVPSDATEEQVSALVLNRRNPENNPLTFLSCTDKDSEAKWMKDIEEAAPFCAEYDDFNDERDEVAEKQGPAMPFSRGLYEVANLVGAINPDDLDAMDDTVPFTKGTMDNLMGRVTTLQEYEYYFRQVPINSKTPQLSTADFQQFCRTDIVANEIESVRRYRAGLSQAAASGLTGRHATFGHSQQPAQGVVVQQYP